MRLRLTARYALIITGTVLSVVCIFGLLFAWQMQRTGDELREQSAVALKENLTAAIETRGEDIAQLLAQRLVNSLYQLDMLSMREALQETLDIDGVNSVFVAGAFLGTIHAVS